MHTTFAWKTLECSKILTLILTILTFSLFLVNLGQLLAGSFCCLMCQTIFNGSFSSSSLCSFISLLTLVFSLNQVVSFQAYFVVHFLVCMLCYLDVWFFFQPFLFFVVNVIRWNLILQKFQLPSSIEVWKLLFLFLPKRNWNFLLRSGKSPLKKSSIIFQSYFYTATCLVWNPIRVWANNEEVTIF